MKNFLLEVSSPDVEEEDEEEEGPTGRLWGQPMLKSGLRVEASLSPFFGFWKRMKLITTDDCSSYQMYSGIISFLYLLYFQ